MNEDTAFRRVRIRKILMPLLEDINPKIIETLANTASLMQDLPKTEIHLPPTDELRIGRAKGRCPSRNFISRSAHGWGNIGETRGFSS